MSVQREAERRRDAFVAAASHELCTPMTLTLGFTELFLQRDPGPELRGEWLEAVHQDAIHMSNIVADLLELSRVQSGQVRLRTASVALMASSRRQCSV